MRLMAMVLVATVALLGCRNEHPDTGETVETKRSPTPRTETGSAKNKPITKTKPLPSTALALGGRHTCALVEAGGAVCWGANELGQLGTMRPGTGCSSPDYEGPCFKTPHIVAAPPDGALIAAGTATTCMISSRGESGSVSCWGAGPLGSEVQTTCARSVGSVPCAQRPVAVPETAGATAVSVGGGHVCAIVAGHARCWGNNTDGQVSPAGEPWPVAPIAVAGLADIELIAIAAGDRHSCAATKDQRVICWGLDDHGRLGGSKSEDAHTVEVASLAATQLAAGRAHNCALDRRGRVSCWGANDRGQLGDGTFADRAEPAAVTLTGPATSLALGRDHSCALLAGGKAFCWGANDLGQLGDGSYDMRASPVAVTGLSGAKSIGAGRDHTCAIRESGGEIVCWGSNRAFQLGRSAASAHELASVEWGSPPPARK